MCICECVCVLSSAGFIAIQEKLGKTKLLISFSKYYNESYLLLFAFTGCPKVLVIFDTPLFSGLGGPITKSIDVVIAECGCFFEV